MVEPLRIGIAGLGTVGRAVADILLSKNHVLSQNCDRELLLTGVSARDKHKNRGLKLDGVQWFDDPLDLAASPDIDCFVELIGGNIEFTKHLVETAFSASKHVVTANKSLLARHGLELALRAEKQQLALGFEAAVAGGIPIVKTLRESLAGNDIIRISGILNGTCNYILSRMETEGIGFADCLKDAQKLGYAEADPAADIDGHDTAHKLCLLTSLAFGVAPDFDAVFVEGISSLTLLDLSMADELGFRIKLLGVASRTPTGIEQRVHPTMVAKSSPIAQVMGVTNAVTVDADCVGSLTLVGPGAGGNATASSVLSDLADIAKGHISCAFGKPAPQLTVPQQAPMQRHEGGYYIRLSVFNRKGVAAGVAARMAEAGISLESIVQKRSEPLKNSSSDKAESLPVQVVLITYATTEDTIRWALDHIHQDGLIAEPPQVIRIERE